MSLFSRRPYARWLFVLISLALLALLFWWTLWRTDSVIETEPIRRGNLELSVSALGTLQPHRYVDIGAQVSGQIKHIAVNVGDAVTKGDLLVEIDPAIQLAAVNADRARLDSLRAQLAEQEAERELAGQKTARQQRLHRQEATSIETLQEAQAQLRVAQARVTNLKAQIVGAQSTLEGNEALLGYTRIYAPMDGTVITLDAREGQTLNATYQTPTLLRLADLTRMTVWTEVSEADVGRIRPGMPVYFTTLGLLDEDGSARRWESHLRQVLPAPPTAQGAAPQNAGDSAAPAGKVVLYTALFDVDNQDGALMPQMSAQVFFVAATATNVLLVPLTAVESANKGSDRYIAHVLTEDEVQPREIRIGIRDRLMGEVLRGLDDGEIIVTSIREERPSWRLQW